MSGADLPVAAGAPKGHAVDAMTTHGRATKWAGAILARKGQIGRARGGDR